jgi:energy-coupling factor transporter transmembrane protein EcfT
MERRAIKLQRLDTTLHRLLPFALVLAFLIASVVVTFVGPIVGGAGLVATMAGVLIAYLTGRVPNVQPPEDRPTSQ